MDVPSWIMEWVIFAFQHNIPLKVIFSQRCKSDWGPEHTYCHLLCVEKVLVFIVSCFKLIAINCRNVYLSSSCRQIGKSLPHSSKVAHNKPYDVTKIVDTMCRIATECLQATVTAADTHVPPHAISMQVENTGESSKCPIFSPVGGKTATTCLNANFGCKHSSK